MKKAQLYFEMCKIRQAEEIIRREYSKDQIRTPVHLCHGAEAIAVGVLSAFPKPRIYGTYRNHHWYLASTQDFSGFWAELYAKEGAPNGGRSGSMHLSNPKLGYILSSAVVASTIPLAVGDAWAKRESDTQTICFFGDGATEEGVFWESLNMAKLMKAPILFVCEDNGWSIHTEKRKRQSYCLMRVAESFACSYFSGSALNVLEVQSLANQAKDSLKDGPVLLHLKYERLLEHVGIHEDYQVGYRSKPDKRAEEVDPVEFFKTQFIESEALTIKKSAEEFVEASWLSALAAPNLNGAEVKNHVFRVER